MDAVRRVRGYIIVVVFGLRLVDVTSAQIIYIPACSSQCRTWGFISVFWVLVPKLATTSHDLSGTILYHNSLFVCSTSLYCVQISAVSTLLSITNPGKRACSGFSKYVILRSHMDTATESYYAPSRDVKVSRARKCLSLFCCEYTCP